MSRSTIKTSLAPVLLVLALVCGLATDALAQDGDRTFRVRYRSADTVYLDAGRDAGVNVGDRLEVLSSLGASAGARAPVAVLEVVFTSRRSSSCVVIEQSAAEGAVIEPGSVVRPLGPLASSGAAARDDDAVKDRRTTSAPRASARSTTATRRTRSEPPRRTTRRRTRVSGVLSYDWLSVDETPGTSDDDDADDDPSFERDITTARLSLRARDIAGLPLSLRVRARSRSVERAGPRAGGVPADEDRDRLYELSLAYQPQSGRWGLHVGRLGVGAYSGIGYLDGASGHVRLFSRVELGAFYGSRPELTDLGLETDGTKYGVFTRLVPGDGSERWQVFAAGIHEEDGLDERDLVVLETSLGGSSRWRLFQRAELALDSTTGTAIDDGGKLTQLSLVLTGELSDTSRVVLSYDLDDPILFTEEDEFDRPAEQFEDLLRQGFRARLQFGRPGSTIVSLTGGLRTGESVDDDTVSVGLGLYRPQRSNGGGFSFGGDLLGFSNAFTEGALATIRARRGFTGGHSLGVVLGSSLHTEDILDEELLTSWARLTGWVELPLSLFARGEVEVSFGDDREGERLGLGVGYRF